MLGFAYKKLQQLPTNPEDALIDLEFLGMAAIIDPLRPDVKEAVQLCKQASIKVAMVTGDHPKTAIAIAKEAGLQTFSIPSKSLASAKLSEQLSISTIKLK